MFGHSTTAHHARTVHRHTKKTGVRMTSTKTKGNPQEKTPSQATKRAVTKPRTTPPTIAKKGAPALTTSRQPTPATSPTSNILEQVHGTGTLKATPSLDHLPKNPATLHPSRSRTNTIPLPANPRQPPSHSNPKPNTVFAKPAPPNATPSPPPAYRPAQSSSTRRIIEPTPDIRLPKKYKPAARRVTSIIVGIPIILVVGYELYNRYRAEIRTKWDEGGKRV